MVLSRPPHAARLVAAAAAAAVAAATAVTALGAAAGCNQSLFDNHGNPGGPSDGSVVPPGGDGAVPASCPTGCIGDAAGDYNGTATGSTGHWRYLEDLTGRSWQAMTPSSTGMTGKAPDNHITTCQQHAAAACAALPGALLVSATGGSNIDPAIEFTAPATQVLQLSLRSYLAAGPDAAVLVYRNSRDDLLFTAPLTAAALVEHAITLDALAGDRFLIAITGATPAADVGVQLFFNATGERFPRDCAVAIPTPGQTGTTVADRCGGSTTTFFAYDTANMTSAAATAQFAAGPFPELSPSLTIPRSHFLERDLGHLLGWSHDITVQFWVELRMLYSAQQSFVFSDLDPDACAGLQVWFALATATDALIQFQSCTNPTAMTFDMTSAPYPSATSWHFVRIVRTSDHFALCLDGQSQAAMLAAPPDPNATSNPIDVGKENIVTPIDTYLDGQLADLRVFNTALPCQ